ncbi:MAG: hypothetical protein JXN60_01035, partial [Lentisphaerae bacterium]|nr:hypothetical protein [Lentisphaerota bacterium]
MRILCSPLCLIFLLATIVMAVHWAEDYGGGIRSNDVHVYWQYARNLADGKGLVRNTLSTGE